MPDTFAETSPIVVKKEPGKTLRKTECIEVAIALFNDYATKSLLDGCLKRFDELGVDRNAMSTPITVKYGLSKSMDRCDGVASVIIKWRGDKFFGR